MARTDPSPSPDPDASPAPPEETRLLIDQLMAGPTKGLPKIIVVGDDAVSGINPLPRKPA